MNIPIIDYRDSEAAAKFVKSIRETGFAVLSNTPVKQDLIDEVYRDFREFFEDDMSKNELKFDPKKQYGYFPFKSEKAKDASVQDLKEFFHYFPNLTEVQPNPSGWAMDELCFSLEDLGQEILDWLQTEYLNEFELNDPKTSWSTAVANSRNTLLRVLHYPPLTGSEDPGAVRSAAHEDINFITLLPAATQSGLQVKDRAGNWHTVNTDKNCIVVNVGDMLQLLTNGYYPSTTHRVVNPEGQNVSRYSMPLFMHPHSETQLSPDKTAKQYLDERLAELGLK